MATAASTGMSSFVSHILLLVWTQGNLLPTVDKPPVYSKAVLKILGASSEFYTPTEVIAHMKGSVVDDWRKTWPDGFRLASPVELRGVCCKYVLYCSYEA